MRLSWPRVAAAVGGCLLVVSRALLAGASPPHGSSERWSSRFLPDAPIANVYDVTTAGGDIYVTGIAIGPGTRDLVRWDGRRWVSIAPDLGWSSVHRLAEMGGDLYAAGSFSQIGGTHAPLIARWNGETWTSLGAGIDGIARDLHVWNGALYICGESVEHAGGVAVNHVARWDGLTWSAVGEGLPGGDFPGGTVSDLDSTATRLYAISGGKVAEWDGSAWAWLEPQNPGYATDLAVVGDDLYVAGQINDEPLQDDDEAMLLRWTGNQWIHEGDGLSAEPDFWIHDLAAVGETLYVAENRYDNVRSSYTPRLTSFDGTSWSLVSEEFRGSISGNGPVSGVGRIGPLATAGDTLLVGGTFDTIGDVAAPRLAQWDGTTWRAVGYSGGLAPTSLVQTLTVHHGELYAGGRFGAIAGVAAHGIARWDGKSWSALAGGTDGDVWSTLSDGEELYAGGEFTEAGQVEANSIARWDGSSWTALGQGVGTPWGWPGRVFALAKWNGDLYAGGGFSRAGGHRAEAIAKWDGQAWSEVGGGVYGNVTAMAAMDNGLYLGGDFDYGQSKIKRWDGTSFTDIERFDGVLRAMVAVENGIVIAGGLNETGDVFSPGIVLWDGLKFVAWPVPLPAYTGVGAIAVSGSDVFVSAYGVDGQYVARWDGEQWTSFGPTVGDRFAIAAFGGDLFVGGDITSAGGKPSYHLAKYRFADPFEVCGDITGDEVLTASDALGVLRAAVGTVECSPDVCDFNGDGQITAPDALATLQAALGLPTTGLCS